MRPERAGDGTWTAVIAAQFAELLGIEEKGDRSRRLDLLCSRHPAFSDSIRQAFHDAERRREVPERIGGYRILAELGRGGMGIVHAAERLDSGQSVAIKCLLPERRLTQEALDRFERETRLNAALTHPNCVFVYESGVVDGQPFFVMELLPGPDLETLVQERGPLPVSEAIRLTLDIIDGLTAAHDIGILHRDVKPGNCLLAVDGRVKVADFGLSKSLHSSLALTGENMQLGTLGYASPEQLRGDALDYRADVFSCGATLYMLLTGRRAFAGETPGAVLEATFAGRVVEPDPALGLPVRLERWLLRCLAVDPADRPQDLRVMRAELETMLPENQEPARPFERIVSFFGDVALAWMGTLWFGGLAYLLLPDPWLRTVGFGYALRVHTGWDSWLNHLVILLIGWVPYHTLSTLLLGGSVAQRVIGIRVLKRNSLARPGVLQLLVRNLIFGGGQFLLAPVVVAGVLTPLLANSFFGDFFAVLVVGGVLFAPVLRHRRLAGLHELLSGTRTVYRRPTRAAVERPVAVSAAAESRAESDVPSFPAYTDVVPVPGIPNCFSATDPSLQRRVFLVQATSTVPAAVLDEAPRATRVRQIGLARVGERQYPVMAQPAGVPLRRHLESGPAGWSWTRQLLAQLLDELVAAREDGTLPPRLCIEQLFVGSQARLQFMPWLPGAGTSFDSGSDAGVLRFVAHVAGQCVAGGAGESGADARPIPLHASRFLRELPSLGSLEAARTRLAELAKRRTEVEPRQRFTAVAGVVFALTFVAVTLTEHLAVDFELPIARAIGHLELRAFDASVSPSGSVESERLHGNVHDLRAAIEHRAHTSPVLVAAGIGGTLTGDLVLHVLHVASTRDLRVYGPMHPVQYWPMRLGLDESTEPPGGVQDFPELRRVWLADERRFVADGGDPFELARDAERRAEGRRFRMGLLLGITILGAIVAFCSRGGLGFLAAGVVVVGADGRPASRWRAMQRSTVVGCVAVLLAALAEGLIAAGGALQFAGELLVLVLVCCVLGYAFVSYRNPRRMWQDRLAGTYLVPR